MTLVFCDKGDRFGTRAGWTATIDRIDALRAEGTILTDWTRYPCKWTLDGKAETPCDDLIEKLP